MSDFLRERNRRLHELAGLYALRRYRAGAFGV